MARDWFAVETARVRDPSFIALAPAVRANWLTLLALCAEQENGGLILGPQGRSRSAWGSLGVTTRALRDLETAGLVKREDSGLRVLGYDLKHEQSFQASRARNRHAAAKRWAGHAASNATGNATGNAAGNATGNAGGIADEIREEKKDPPNPPTGGANLSEEPPGFVAFWEALPSWLRERRDAAVRTWQALGIEEDLTAREEIQKALRVQKASESWVERNKRQNLTAKTYLTQRRWKDDGLIQIRRTSISPVEPESVQDDLVREWEADPACAGRPFPGREEAWKELSSRWMPQGQLGRPS
jgi:hypothetical protein